MEETNMALLDKLLGRDEREENLKKELQSLELRKASVFSTIDGEISRLQNEKQNVLLAAGSTAYDSWCKDQTHANLMEYWTKIQELEKAIVEQEAKKEEMGNRYDEEIRLISSNLNIANTTTPISATSISGANKCPSCGAPIATDDIFCQGCGTKLK